MDVASAFRAFAALLFVLGLIGLAALGARRFAPGMSARARGGGRNQKRRLELVEAVAIDTRHRLLLVRRDDTEHLLLVGLGGSLVVETGIAPPPQSEPPVPTETKALSC